MKQVILNLWPGKRTLPMFNQTEIKMQEIELLINQSEIIKEII